MCSQGVRTRSTIVILICRGRSLNNLEFLRRHQKTSDQVLNLELAPSRRPRLVKNKCNRDALMTTAL